MAKGNYRVFDHQGNEVDHEPLRDLARANASQRAEEEGQLHSVNHVNGSAVSVHFPDGTESAMSDQRGRKKKEKVA